MKKLFLILLTTGLALGVTTSACATTQEEDIQALRSYFKKKFPRVPFREFANGPYALSADKRINWETMRDFPPYEDHLVKGEELWDARFKNGNSFASCFGDDVSKVRNRFPHWNAHDKKVETLEANITLWT